MFLVTDYIKELKPKMNDHHLIEVYIRNFDESLSVIEVFFLIDKNIITDEDNKFWKQVLSTIRENGPQASVSTNDQWESSKKRGGWTTVK